MNNEGIVVHTVRMYLAQPGSETKQSMPTVRTQRQCPRSRVNKFLTSHNGWCLSMQTEKELYRPIHNTDTSLRGDGDQEQIEHENANTCSGDRETRLNMF